MGSYFKPWWERKMAAFLMNLGLTWRIWLETEDLIECFVWFLWISLVWFPFFIVMFFLLWALIHLFTTVSKLCLFLALLAILKVPILDFGFTMLCQCTVYKWIWNCSPWLSFVLSCVLIYVWLMNLCRPSCFYFGTNSFDLVWVVCFCLEINITNISP